jgi:hypothetical protein
MHDLVLGAGRHLVGGTGSGLSLNSRQQRRLTPRGESDVRGESTPFRLSAPR